MEKDEQPDEQLMAVLLDEPSPSEDGLAADRYAAAERDMGRVREQLQWIGGGLARHAASGPPRRARASWRRRGLFALAASVAVALIGTGVMYSVAHSGDAEDSAAEARLTDEGIIACSSVVAEGTVARVEPLDEGEEFRVVLDVDRYYKPESGKPQLTFTSEGAKGYYRAGARMLVVVSRLPAEGPETYRADDPVPSEDAPGQARDALEWGRQWIEKALPGAVGLECPGE
ncbi:hypothetical protein CLM62_29900 [Streptomyces sp. SA15]|nr:hypothetical protein CLM62_29900 [Streptomyces sp. SA15]